ncbi:MAG TPA: ATP-grasp domain-containing protein [Blastocatellia bacterium]|jgi:carbamoyl-phosphate synthase large subunit|nr:ATP-grasp domain-containing protein [Blastocatellia bacterium]
MINVLFTSAGRRVELLRAFRNAYESLGLEGRIIALDIDPLAPALQVADSYYMVPRLDSPEYIPALTRICSREKPALIFPLIDPDIPVLARHREELEATGARVAVVSSEAARITSDKWKTVEFFNGLGLRTARSWLPEHIDPRRAEFPLFIKPREGSASQHTFKINNAEELAFFSKYVQRPIIQEYLPGPEITSDITCDVDGSLLGVVSRRRIEVRSGEVSKGVTVRDRAVVEACVKIAKGLPAIGPITAQCMMKDGVPHFTEINARLGGGLPLAIASGADSPRWLLARAAGLPVDVPPLGSYRENLFLTRYDDSFLLSEGDREDVAGHRF